MENGSKFYMVKKKALPEILLKVAEANVLLNRGKAKTIKEAIDAVGISRSSYYKYKDDIFPIQMCIRDSIHAIRIGNYGFAIGVQSCNGKCHGDTVIHRTVDFGSMKNRNRLF